MRALNRTCHVHFLDAEPWYIVVEYTERSNRVIWHRDNRQPAGKMAVKAISLAQAVIDAEKVSLS